MAASEAPGLFEAAAEGLLALYAVSPAPEPVEAREIRLEAQPLEDLLVAWLNELIYLTGTKRWVPARAGVREAGTNGLRATLEGAPLGRSKLALEIKAATFGGLNVRREPDGSYATTVILDV